MKDLHTFWGDTHHNTYTSRPEDNPDMDAACRVGAGHLDFYATAYYTAFAEAFRPGGHAFQSTARQDLILEGWKDPERLDREWAEVQEACRSHYEPGRFVTFPGYEWQGDGSSGDHNVYYAEEGHPIFRARTIQELYQCLRGLPALAIPHHTAYRPGRRGRDWSVLEEELSPFAELYSVHGCSETDEEWIGLRRNTHMGPGMAGGTYQEALDRGLHLGAVCSTDGWGAMPGQYGCGLMACRAPDLTRESLWEALNARRVYGVTGDRILLEFSINDAPMGSIIRSEGRRVLRVTVRGSDALDRIEVLRNGRVIATHCHQGTWHAPLNERVTRFKVRVEVGWGPRANELDVPDRQWHGQLTLDGGRFLNFEPCWISAGQQRPDLTAATASFTMRSSNTDVGHPTQNANVFEFEATPRAQLHLRLNGMAEAGTVDSFMRGSRVLWFKDECVRMLHEVCGLEPGSPEREDVYHHMAYKAKIHRVMPEAAYAATFEIEDDEPIQAETHYRVRVEQRNGQRAWSSPIWVRRPGAS
ncbi:MAG: DUF3604 domain-containing protein [Candidatus Brocadiae bacterium]|nr:DUF3604 domain-containing protein [Candidatus Brocadiia bacterium]